MTLTDADLRALRVLVGWKGAPLRAGGFGALLWSNTHRPPQAFSRPAARILRRLEAHGLARQTTQWEAEGFTGWEPTTAGRKRAAAP